MFSFLFFSFLLFLFPFFSLSQKQIKSFYFSYFILYFFLGEKRILKHLDVIRLTEQCEFEVHLGPLDEYFAREEEEKEKEEEKEGEREKEKEDWRKESRGPKGPVVRTLSFLFFSFFLSFPFYSFFFSFLPLPFSFFFFGLFF